jgi:nucleolar complex protein 2
VAPIIGFAVDQKFSFIDRFIAVMGKGRTTKATKKFESNHLARTIKNRKIQKKNKQKHANNKKVHNDSKGSGHGEAVDEAAHQKAVGKKNGVLIEDMTMDEFLENGGDDLEAEKMNVDAEEAEDDVAELATSHKTGLENLKEKDPEFYKFLKDNDRELLEFDPDELVELEEVEEDPVKGGLTVDVLNKWERLLIEEQSLGTLRKVLIAVRSAAANVTGEEEMGNAKYVLTDPEGMCTQRG